MNNISSAVGALDSPPAAAVNAAGAFSNAAGTQVCSAMSGASLMFAEVTCAPAAFATAPAAFTASAGGGAMQTLLCAAGAWVYIFFFYIMMGVMGRLMTDVVQ